MKAIEETMFQNDSMSKALRSLGYATNTRMTEEKISYFLETIISKGYESDAVVKSCNELAMGDRFPNLGEFLAVCRRNSNRSEVLGCIKCSMSGIIHLEKEKEILPGKPMFYETAFACNCEKGRSNTTHMSFKEGLKNGYTFTYLERE